MLAGVNAYGVLHSVSAFGDSRLRVMDF